MANDEVTTFSVALRELVQAFASTSRISPLEEAAFVTTSGNRTRGAEGGAGMKGRIRLAGPDRLPWFPETEYRIIRSGKGGSVLYELDGRYYVEKVLRRVGTSRMIRREQFFSLTAASGAFALLQRSLRRPRMTNKERIASLQLIIINQRNLLRNYERLVAELTGARDAAYDEIARLKEARKKKKEGTTT
jgi:hypothetical protein